jgi:LuxR family maltose regulon positive regulatory protein
MGACLAAAYHAHGLIMTGHLEEAEALLAGLKGRATGIGTRALTLNALYWLAIDQGRFNAIAPLYGEQVELLQGSSQADLVYQTSPPLRLPGAPGVMRHLARHAELMLRVTEDEPTPLRPLGMLSQAWVAAWHGELTEARRLRELARTEAAWSGSSGAVVAHLLTHAAFELAMSGDHAGAVAAARERAQRQAHLGAWGRCVLAALLVRITAACNDLDGLRVALSAAREQMAQLRAAGTPFNEAVIETAAAQLAWLEGRTADAIAGWRAALRDPEAIDLVGQATETRVRLARALLRTHDLPGAAALIAEVLATARREEGPGGALLAGDALREIATASWNKALTPTDTALLRSWLRSTEVAVATAALPDADLSARELEVLERIAAGESNKVIARALDLSLHTVKRHVANILGKLGVATRGQAAALFNSRRH